MAAAQPEKTPLDVVQQSKILVETFRKEQKTQKLHTHFSINPFKKLHVLSDKPMSKGTQEKFKEDPAFIKAVHAARLEPTKKYSYPQTESQEIGWISRPLIDTDRRMNHHRQNSDITKYMDAAWRIKEQTQNLS